MEMPVLNGGTQNTQAINTEFKKIRRTCFWNVCHAPQNYTAHPGILPTEHLLLTIEVYRRTSMDSSSFPERKCPNRGENKVTTVHQGEFLSQLESFSMVYVLHEHLSQLGTYATCSLEESVVEQDALSS